MLMLKYRCFVQIYNVRLHVRNRRNTHVHASIQDFFGVIDVTNYHGNSSEQAAAFFIPSEAFDLAITNFPSYNEHLLTIFFKNEIRFPSQRNLGQVNFEQVLNYT